IARLFQQWQDVGRTNHRIRRYGYIQSYRIPVILEVHNKANFRVFRVKGYRGNMDRSSYAHPSTIGNNYSLFSFSPLQTSEYRIYNPRKKYEGSKNSNYGVRIFRFPNKFPDFYYLIQWVWFLVGIVGLIIGLYGLTLVFLGYLSFPDSRSNVTLLKGIALMV